MKMTGREITSDYGKCFERHLQPGLDIYDDVWFSKRFLFETGSQVLQTDLRVAT